MKSQMEFTTSSFGTLLSLFLLAVTINAGAEEAHRLDLGTLSVPRDELSMYLQPGGNIHALYRMAALEAFSLNGTITSSDVITSWLPYVNVTIGSPGQTVPMLIELFGQSFFLFGSSAGYNAGDSITATVNEQPFYALWEGATGSQTITDSLLFHDTLNITGFTFGNATTLSDPVSLIADLVDGLLGIAPAAIGSETNLTSFTSQLSTSTPLVSFYLNLSQSNVLWEFSGAGSMTLGAEDGVDCGEGYAYTPLIVDPVPSWRINSLSGVNPSGQAISLSINENRSTVVVPGLPGLAGSAQLVQLLANASGLTYNWLSAQYELASCDDLSSVKSLSMSVPTAGGGSGVMTLSPYDYIFKAVGGDGTEKCVANLWSLYNETASSTSGWSIALGQFFINNHCVAYDYKDVLVGVGNVCSPVLTVYNY